MPLQSVIQPALKVVVGVLDCGDGWRFSLKFEDESIFVNERLFDREDDAWTASRKWADSNLVREQ